MNLIRFLEEYDIYYTDSGHNVKKGNVNIACPFCEISGQPDPSEHMGVSIQPPHVWGCWRNKKHRGKRIAELIVALTNLSWAEAKNLAEGDRPLLDFENVSERVKGILKSKVIEEEEVGVSYLEFPKSFRPIVHVGLYRKFYSYLYSRGFVHYDILKLIEHYDLRGSLKGEFAFRLIVPVFYENKLVSWTGRAISQTASLRYRDLEPAKSVIALKNTLLDFDYLQEQGGRKLFLCEGPFDCFPLFVYGGLGIGATCTFTVNLSEQQISNLMLLSKRFKEIVILPDKGFETSAVSLKRDLSFLKNVVIKQLPEGVKDPGELTRQMVWDLVK